MYEENPSYSYLNFPSHLLHNDVDDIFLDSTILPYPSPPPLLPLSPPPVTNVIREKEKGKRKRAPITTTTTTTGGGGKQKRKRGKTDRHSKIHTAKGPRDRRMRLSLQIARKFFDLQDMLGFDKASKTIEWLFNKSKSAIKDLTQGACTGMPERTDNVIASPSDQRVNGGSKVDTGDKKNKEKGKIKGASLFQVMRGNREKARARARERTKEKLLLVQNQSGDQYQNPNCSSSTTIRVGQIMDQQSRYNQHMIPLEDQMASIGIIEKYLTSTTSSTLFDFEHDNPNIQHHEPMIGPSHEVSFAGFPADWISQNMRMSSSQSEIENPNYYASFMGNPNYNNQGN